MWGKPKLLDSVSMNELLYMREVDGLSNSEIAEKLGVSSQCILNHIGPNPPGIRKPRKKKEKPLPPVEVAVESDPVLLFTERLAALTEAAHDADRFVRNLPDIAPGEVEEVAELDMSPVTEAAKNDVINHPKHYTREGAMESIDEMLLIFGKEAVMHFCVCNAWKYRYRAAMKNGEEDIKKSDWYMAKYKELAEME